MGAATRRNTVGVVGEITDAFKRHPKLFGDELREAGFIAKVVSYGRYVTFQMAEVAVSRQMFADILSLIARLRAPPASA